MNHLIRTIFLPIILISLSISLFSQDQRKVDSTRLVRILTFNIFHGEIRYQPADQLQKSSLEIVAEVIRSAKPDLVALQEVDRNTERADRLDLVVELAMRTVWYPYLDQPWILTEGNMDLGSSPATLFEVPKCIRSILHTIQNPEEPWRQVLFLKAGIRYGSLVPTLIIQGKSLSG